MIEKTLLLSFMVSSLLFCSEELEIAIKELDVEHVERVLNQGDEKIEDVYLIGLVDDLDWKTRDYKTKRFDRRLMGLFGGIAMGFVGADLAAEYVSGSRSSLLAILSLVGGPTMGLWLAHQFDPKFSTWKARSIMYLMLRRLSPEQRAVAKTLGSIHDKKSAIT